MRARATGPLTTMAYSPKLVEQIKTLPVDSLNAKLGRWAVYLDISAVQIAQATGATRQSVYNWFKGGAILGAYRPAVAYLIEVVKTCRTCDEAWSGICQASDLHN